MIFDTTNRFSDSQSVTNMTGSTISTNVIDLGTPGTVLGAPTSLVRDIGPGEPIPILAQVDAVFASNQPGTITAQVINSATATMASSTVVAQTGALTASSLPLGYQIAIAVLPNKISQRYLAMNYLVSNTVTTGTITAGIVAGVQTNLVPGR